MQEPLTSLQRHGGKGAGQHAWSMESKTRLRQDEVLLLSGPAPPNAMSSTCHAGLTSWVKKSSSLFYLLFLGACTHRTQAENLSLHLACMKPGLLPTRNLHLFFTNLRLENPELWGRRAWVNPGPPWDGDAFSMLPAEILSRQSQAPFPFTTSPNATKLLSKRNRWKTPLFED